MRTPPGLASGGWRTWARVAQVLARHGARLRRRAGVVGLGVGLALVARRPTAEPAIRVHVRRKLAGLTGPRALPRRIEGVRVDVIETRFRAAAGCPSEWPHARRDPLKGGVAVAVEDAGAFGTLGACVRDVLGRTLGLASGHVFAGGTPAPRVVQPPSGGVIGAAGRAVIDPHVDASVLHLTGARDTAFDVRGRKVAGTLDPVPLAALPLEVTVVGGCSGFSAGLVTGIEATAEVDYDGDVMTVVDHYLVVSADGGEVTRGGDSGALVLETATNRVVGMVRAGEPDGAADFALVAPIAATLAAFDVAFG